MFKKTKSKKQAKAAREIETLQRHQFGNFELRISLSKVEIEDVVHKLFKHVYALGGYEYGLISHLLSTTKTVGEVVEAKTEKEINEGISNVQFLVIMLAHTNLIFSNDKFRTAYYKLIQKTLKVKAEEVNKEEDDKILAEEKTLLEMQNTVQEEVK